MTINRRQLLNTGAASGAGLLAGAALLQSPARAAAGAGTSSGSGPLFPPLESSDGDLLALPPGFSYEVVAVSGQTDLAGGAGKTPERPDGTLVVATNNGYRLIQNHEASPGSSQPVPPANSSKLNSWEPSNSKIFSPSGPSQSGNGSATGSSGGTS